MDMKVYKPADSSKYYMNFTFRGQRVHRSTKTSDKRQALMLAQDTLREMEAQAIYGKPIEMTLASAMKRYLSDHVEPGRKGKLEATYQKQIGQLGRILDHFGPEMPISQITKEKVAELRSKCFAAGNSRSTVNKYLTSLRAVLNMACHEWGVLKTVPKIKREHELNNRVRWLEDEKDEELRLLAACDDPALKDLIIFLLDTGGRRGEALQLERKDVHWQTRMVRFDKTKSGRPRSLDMTDRVWEILDRRLKDPTITKVFPWDPNTGKRTDQPLNYRSCPHRNKDGTVTGIYPKGAGFEARIRVKGKLIYLGFFPLREEAVAAREMAEKKYFRRLPKPDVNQAFNQVVARAGIQNFHMHDLRHDFATRHLRAGTELVELRDMLGHSNLVMTERYAHLQPGRHKAAMQRFNRPVEGSPTLPQPSSEPCNADQVRSPVEAYQVSDAA